MVWTNSAEFLKRAGTIIFCLSIVLWAMSYYPRLPEERVKAIEEQARAQVLLPIQKTQESTSEVFVAPAAHSDAMPATRQSVGNASYSVSIAQAGAATQANVATTGPADPLAGNSDVGKAISLILRSQDISSEVFRAPTTQPSTPYWDRATSADKLAQPLPAGPETDARLAAQGYRSTTASAGNVDPDARQKTGSPESAELKKLQDDAAEQAVASEQLRYSISGRLGHLLEPAIRPLGYDWKMGVGLVSAFAAREVFVSTMGIVYSAGEDDTASLAQAMHADTYPDGKPVWRPLVAVSLLVWFVLAMQCMSTVAVVRRETGGWRWPLFMIGYMNVLAYTVSLAVFQLGSAMGF